MIFLVANCTFQDFRVTQNAPLASKALFLLITTAKKCYRSYTVKVKKQGECSSKCKHVTSKLSNV